MKNQNTLPHSSTDQAPVSGLPVQSSKSLGKKRPVIDYALRAANRAKPTEEVLRMLRALAPQLYDLAEVVGKWVWVQFEDKQPPQVTSVLAQFGFHWNNTRQVWQHPCGGTTADVSQDDPRAKYGSRPAAEALPA